MRGLFAAALDFCQAVQPNLRVDTHADNAPMLHSIEKAGFTRCGIIYHTDGTPRIAFQRSPADHEEGETSLDEIDYMI